jgi:hypothetical protein
MAGQLYTTSYQQMMTEMQSFAVRCAGGGAIDPNGPDGYSNPFTRWIGENLVRGVLEDARLTKQGGVGDDILLSTLVVTHYTQYVDPTPASGLINSGSRVIDGDHDAIDDLLINSLALGGGLRRATELAKSGQKVQRGLGGIPGLRRLGANPYGSKGAPDHQDAIRELIAIMRLLFPTKSGQYRLLVEESIKNHTGPSRVNRSPDVAVLDVKSDRIVCVGEAARQNTDGTLVKREQVKVIEYLAAGLEVIHKKLPKKRIR